MPAISPLSALLVPWVLVLTLASLPGVLGNKLSQGTWTFALLCVFSLATGILAGWLVPRRVSDTKESVHQVATGDSFPQIVARWHCAFTVALIAWSAIQVSNAWPLVKQMGGLNVVFSASGGVGGEYKYQLTKSRLELVQGSFDSASALTGALGYLLFLGHIALFTGAILWVMGRKTVAVLPLIAIAGYSLFSLQRTSFFMAGLLFLSSVYLVKKSGVVRNFARSKKRRVPIVTVGAVGLAAAVLLYPLQQRNAGTSNSTGLLSVGQYIVASISGLNARIDPVSSAVSMPLSDMPGSTAPFPGYGAYTFGGLFSILVRLGLPLSRAPQALDYHWVNLFGQSSTTNTGSFFLDLYLDFGMVGMIAVSFMLGLAAGLTYKMCLGGEVWILPAAAFFFVTTLWSFFGNAIIGDFRFLYMTVIACLFLRRFFRWRWKEEALFNDASFAEPEHNEPKVRVVY
ncbi:O-antigen polymerase [Arthrobacter sunyaminii]|uniref:O-antigen polymerase n=1 Tax=Arthrobacter sunyaminii TaxID=2816859 RepID=UPI001A944C2F|nr:O-antigen polymerase [Arthrobacter sunyaminii]MBO0896450.1 oligosaccharide repeat unit polymerase [Arthrobacter sunyaminii]